MTSYEERVAAVAKIIQRARDEWPLELELLAFKARVAKARFDAARKAGFEVSQALALCLKDVELGS